MKSSSSFFLFSPFCQTASSISTHLMKSVREREREEGGKKKETGRKREKESIPEFIVE